MLYRQWSSFYLAWARARLGQHETGTTELKGGLAARREAGYKAWTPLFAGLLAQVEAERNQHSEALSRIAETLMLAKEISEHWVGSFLQRIRGEILSKGDPVETVAAEEAFIAAIAIARRQKAKSFELHAALSLASSINRLDGPPKPAGYSPLRSKTFRQRRRCRTSPRRWPLDHFA